LFEIAFLQYIFVGSMLLTRSVTITYLPNYLILRYFNCWLEPVCSQEYTRNNSIYNTSDSAMNTTWARQQCLPSDRPTC